jgi:site-specific recombinase XerD
LVEYAECEFGRSATVEFSHRQLKMNKLFLVIHVMGGWVKFGAEAGYLTEVVASAAGLNPKEWTPRELRHSFVSLLSSSGVTIEEIAHLVGHGSTSVTERVYRKELRPVITRAARAINELFDGDAKR